MKEFNALYNHKCSEERRYKAPQDPTVLQSLEDFKDKKFGLMMHWGIYSQLGIIESWALPDQDRKWAWNGMDKYQHMSGKEFREFYWGQIKEFNPTNLDPDKWAAMAKQAGFKYYILTTKHHDGFCMWDTKYSNFKITSPLCPYSNNANADICRVLYDAFRKQGIGINAYFSKPDWHSEFFWPNGYSKGEYRTRMTSYNTLFHHKIWKKFAEFTKNQLLELVSNYGKIDCLWLDGGQVCKAHGMDIKLSDIMQEARKIQPGLMVADRTIGGINENFLTPEQTVPDHVINVPWESCLTLGEAFSYRENDIYKDARTIIHLLCNIVAKGGNLALNIAPNAKGDIPDKILPILSEIGSWMQRNGYAIYRTRPIAPFAKDNFAYTSKGDEVYAIYLEKQGETLGGEYTLYHSGKANSVLFNGKPLEFTQIDNAIKIKIAPSIANDLAHVFTIK